MKKIIFLFVTLIINSHSCVYATSQDKKSDMTPIEAINILNQGPKNWFGWCDVIEKGTKEVLSNNDVQTAMVALLERISLARDNALTNNIPSSEWAGCDDECGECLELLENSITAHDEHMLKIFVRLGALQALEFGDSAFPLVRERYQKGNSSDMRRIRCRRAGPGFASRCSPQSSTRQRRRRPRFPGSSLPVCLNMFHNLEKQKTN